MNFQDYFKNVAESIRESATVKAVYGDPVESQGKTIIPVAKIRYGFGGGGGSGEDASPEGATAVAAGATHKAMGMGGGGGGGVSVTPAGYIEIRPDGTEYVSFEEKPQMIRVGIIAILVVGFIIWRKV